MLDSMSRGFDIRTLLGLSFLTWTLGAADPKPSELPPPSTKQVDFDRDIKPIFTTHCAKCHAGKSEKGGLKLDDPKAALAGGNSGPVYVVGISAESKLIHLVASTKSDEVMPPGEAKKLSKDEIGLLRAWIDQGAKWGVSGSTTAIQGKSDHWSFQPIKKVEVQPAKLPVGVTVIDNYIRAAMEKQGLKPSPEADRPTLIRRLSFDLIGLPPTPREIDEFVNDKATNASMKLVDRLLAVAVLSVRSV